MKDRPDFPIRFGCEEHARIHCRHFFAWYKQDQIHSETGFLTPYDVHYGLAEAKRQAS
ncbi:MAG: hypothetical protein ABSB49_22520 [Polyangia bacterium]